MNLRRKNTHQRLKDPTRFDAPDSDEEAWVDELFIKRATIIGNPATVPFKQLPKELFCRLAGHLAN